MFHSFGMLKRLMMKQRNSFVITLVTVTLAFAWPMCRCSQAVPYNRELPLDLTSGCHIPHAGAAACKGAHPCKKCRFESPTAVKDKLGLNSYAAPPAIPGSNLDIHSLGKGKAFFDIVVRPRHRSDDILLYWRGPPVPAGIF